MDMFYCLQTAQKLSLFLSGSLGAFGSAPTSFELVLLRFSTNAIPVGVGLVCGGASG